MQHLRTTDINEKITKAAKYLLHSTSTPHVRANIRCRSILWKKERDVSLEHTSRDTDFPAQMEIKLLETLVLAEGMKVQWKKKYFQYIHPFR